MAMPAEERRQRQLAGQRARYASDPEFRARKLALARAQRAGMSEAQLAADRVSRKLRMRARRREAARARAAEAEAARSAKRARETAADADAAVTWGQRDAAAFGSARFAMRWGCRSCSGPLFWDSGRAFWRLAHADSCADPWQPLAPDDGSLSAAPAEVARRARRSAVRRASRAALRATESPGDVQTGDWPAEAAIAL